MRSLTTALHASRRDFLLDAVQALEESCDPYVSRYAAVCGPSIEPGVIVSRQLSPWQIRQLWANSGRRRMAENIEKPDDQR